MGLVTSTVSRTPEPTATTRAASRPAVERALVLGVLCVLFAGLLLRFRTTSALWLDEALTVNISSQPLSQLDQLLRHDGAPPLFYVLLHFWMGMLGHSDLAVRSLSGVLSCATLPLVWTAGRRLGSRSYAIAVLLLMASSPFAVRYATEARMYSLVALLVAGGTVAMQGALARPRPGNLIALGLCCAALLYTHYWAVYLLVATGLWTAWRVWRGPDPGRAAARKALAALVVGSLAFVPWVPTFLYQSAHTGTPWAAPANFAAMVDAVSSFAGGATNQGRALGLLFFALGGLGLFGVATGRYAVELDLRTRPRGRRLAVVVVGTLVAAIVGGYISRSAFQGRYAMVVLVPLLLMVAIGLGTLADRKVRLGVLSACVVFGLAGSAQDVTAQRSEAPKVVAVLAQLGRPGDVVAYCPDQLGPDVSRLLPPRWYQQITFPRGTSPAFVDWVDYAKATAAASPSAFVDDLLSTSGADHQIWLVWYGGYQTYGTKCEQIAGSLLADRALGAREVVPPLSKYFEPMHLVRFVHLGPPSEAPATPSG